MLRIREALKYALLSGKNISRMDLARAIFPDSKRETQEVNITNLLTGKTKRPNPEWIPIICELTGVDANFLFNIKPMSNE